jgi:hypothetical protein
LDYDVSYFNYLVDILYSSWLLDDDDDDDDDDGGVSQRNSIARAWTDSKSFVRGRYTYEYVDNYYYYKIPCVAVLNDESQKLRRCQPPLTTMTNLQSSNSTTPTPKWQYQTLQSKMKQTKNQKQFPKASS